MSAYCCPFYGFSSPSPEMPVMMDSSGNQCALERGSFSPCQMEMGGKTPGWEQCPIRQKQGDGIMRLMREQKVRVYPDATHPHATGSSSGMPFEEWVKRVMSEP